MSFSTIMTQLLKIIHRPFREQSHVGTTFFLQENLPELLSHNKVCGLSRVTGSWFLQRDSTVEFFKCIFWCFEHQKLRVILSHYIGEKADISTADVSKTLKLTDMFFFIFRSAVPVRPHFDICWLKIGLHHYFNISFISLAILIINSKE